jgi:hypothetical protein
MIERSSTIFSAHVAVVIFKDKTAAAICGDMGPDEEDRRKHESLLQFERECR